MSTNRLLPVFLFGVSGAFVFLILFMYVTKTPTSSRASSNTLHMKIKLQGNYKNLDKIRSSVAFYDGPGALYEEPSVEFVAMNGVFESDLILKNDFDFSKPYALFLKPQKYTGRLFCLEKITGTSCTVPAFRFMQSGSSVDLTDTIFFGGDIPPPNGKVDAKDLSEVMTALGKMAPDASSDINSDGITDVTDYSLTLYSLSKNITDDAINLTAPPTTPQVTMSPTPSSQLTPTAEPTVTPIPSPQVTPTVAPTSTPIPTATTAPTPTVPAGGTCHGVPFIGETFDVPNGITPCDCDGNDCYITNCVCPSGTCSCTITSPAGANCSNGGKISFTKCTK